MISFIVAMDENRVIGKDNQLPWHLPEDLKFFKRVTMGHPIAMGRKTHESIGRVLPGRENIVITRQVNYQSEDCTVFYSIEDFVKKSKKQSEEIFVIGGAEIFNETFEFADRLYITLIHEKFAGDTFFPEFDGSKWELVSSEKGLMDEKNPYDYEFKIYERKS
ncbi:dihydrofolate reductase [Bacillus sp. OV166]|uniref:dihydrofolate reductase n=1 Tax=unclassified Bacillus (in: firmicutes) TaxID=185979 RepID=UPI000A2AA579|nr:MULTISPECIES: dihydrofolate reductase [unclassified Bacillus (in: firmicutes)]PGY14110.1 dihydrofolate reductase [Bacillus sp. AFS031507]SMQ82264.1 dihydrofolate reductase [Bacillus sp. OV166]